MAPSTYRSYEGIIRIHVVPRIGNLRLDKLKPIHIQTMYNKLSQTHLSSATVLYIHRVMHRALGQAVRWRIIPENPTDFIDPPRKRSVKYSTWDNETIVKALDLSKNTLLYIPIVLAVTTGMRVGEICGLQWEDIDLEKGHIYVKYTYQRVDGEWQLRDVKTSGSKRLVVIPNAVIDILKKHKRWQKKNRLLFGPDYKYNNHLNTWPDGRPVLTDYITKEFRKFVIENDLPKIRFHDLRHTHATQLMKVGVNPKIVSERLGHSSIRITLDTYSHVIPTLQKEAAELASENIFGAQDEEFEQKRS